jgi:hypothetical protein
MKRLNALMQTCGFMMNRVRLLIEWDCLVSGIGGIVAIPTNFVVVSKLNKRIQIGNACLELLTTKQECQFFKDGHNL